MSNILKKISPKTIGAQDVDAGYKLFGKANAMKFVTTDKGESVQFFGMFRAIVDATGEIYEGVSAFMPGGYDKLFAEQLKQAQDVTKGAAVDIAVHFHKKPSDNAMGSEWIMSGLSKNTGGQSALDALQGESLPSPRETLKLAAPAKADKKPAAKKKA